MSDFEKFFTSYIECALWSSNDNADETGGDPLDRSYDEDDFAPEAMASMREDCQAFFDSYSKLYTESGWTHEMAGHDFWLTRNGHGAGFWDRGRDNGDGLTEACKPYGSCDIYIGDDGKLHIM